VVGYESAINTVAAAAGAAYAEMVPGARRAKLRELGFFAQAATAIPKAQLGRPGNSPTGGAATLATALDGADIAATAGWTSTWTAAPTAPAAADVKRQFDAAAAIGSGPIWVWDSDRALVVGIARSAVSGLVLWNAGAGAGPILSLYSSHFE
jgi:hypothetical protein